MKIAVGADHAGLAAKEEVKGWLEDWGHEVDDVGTHGPEPVDYPAYAARVAGRVATGRDDLGVLVCRHALVRLVELVSAISGGPHHLTIIAPSTARPARR